MYKASQPVGNLYNASRPEESSVVAIADAGVYESFIVTCPAVSAATQGDYFTFENQAGDTYAVWLDIDAAGTPPSGAAYTAATTKIEVDVATGDTAAQVRTAVLATLGSLTDMTAAASSTAAISIVNDLLGPATNPADTFDEDDSGAGSFTLSAEVAGVASNLQNTYFEISSPTIDYYVWMNVGAEGVDPAPAGTGIEVTLSASDNASAVATAIATAVDGDAAFAATSNGATVSIRNAVTGDAANIGAGDSGMTVNGNSDGSTGGLLSPSASTGTIKVEPDLI